jgi:hypothetical protein
MLEGLEMAGLAVGSLAVPALVAVGGVGAALVGIGGALMVFSAAAIAAVGRIVDGLAVSPSLLELVRRTPLFAMLGAPVLEDVARALEPVGLLDGEDAVREGKAGDRYYIVAEGRLGVTIGGEPIRTLHPADGFGEIALLRDGIRTATVTACGPVTLRALPREAFLDALGASRHARRAAESLVIERVGHLV